MGRVIKMPFRGTTFHSHKNHNPTCDILIGHLPNGADLTYCIEVNGPTKGAECCEYYSGENYTDTKARSYSRNWKSINIPQKYFNEWQLLRQIYETLPK
jgi:hypothetical protein